MVSVLGFDMTFLGEDILTKDMFNITLEICHTSKMVVVTPHPAAKCQNLIFSVIFQ